MPTSVATADRPDLRDAPVPAPAPASGCGACGHPEAGHDAVGVRWCRATVASALDRACVCQVG